MKSCNLDSIRNSCDVFTPRIKGKGLFSERLTVLNQKVQNRIFPICIFFFFDPCPVPTPMCHTFASLILKFAHLLLSSSLCVLAGWSSVIFRHSYCTLINRPKVNYPSDPNETMLYNTPRWCLELPKSQQRQGQEILNAINYSGLLWPADLWCDTDHISAKQEV